MMAKLNKLFALSNYAEERNAYLNRIENQREMSIQNKFKQTIEQKQR